MITLTIIALTAAPLVAPLPFEKPAISEPICAAFEWRCQDGAEAGGRDLDFGGRDRDAAPDSGTDTGTDSEPEGPSCD